MKRKYIFVGFCIALLMTILGSTVILADWDGPYTDIEGHDCYTGYGCAGYIVQWAEWEEYWDEEEEEYTQYKILTDGWGYIEVDDESDAPIKVEEATLYDYNDNPVGLPPTQSWYDWVYQGYWWYENYPFSDKVLTKPQQNDWTSMDWCFVWNKVLGGWNNPLDGMQFFYDTRDFLYHSGLWP